MAALLRSTSFCNIRLFAGILRPTLATRCASLSSRLQSGRFFSEAAAANVAAQQPMQSQRWNNRKHQINQRINQRKEHDTVDKLLSGLDKDVRRTGRVYLNAVEQVLQMVGKEGSVSGQQAQLLLNTTGSMLAEEAPHNRLELAQKMWQTFESLGLSFETAHYNAMLRIYIENKHQFNPADFLAEMEAKGIAPNRVTYQRLIAQYCSAGDIGGATSILEHMKELKLSINENVFASLITGHLKAGDVETAKATLDIMRRAGMEPVGQTYTALLCGLAERGDLEAMEETLAKVSEEQVTMMPHHYFELVENLATSGHSAAIPKILERVPRSASYNQDAVSTVQQLVSVGQEEAALAVLESMERPLVEDQTDRVFGRFLLRALVRHERPVEAVERAIAQMQEKNLNIDNLSMALFFAIQFGKTDYAGAVLRRMKDQDMPVRGHYFFPLIMAHKSAGDAEGLYGTLAQMNELVRPPVDVTQAMTDFAFPALTQLGQSLDAIHARLTEMGYDAGDVLFYRLAYHVHKRETALAADTARSPGISFYPAVLKPQLASCVHTQEQLAHVVTILAAASERLGDKMADMTSFFLMDLAANHPELLESAVRSIAEKDLKLSRADVPEISRVMKENQCSEEALQMLEGLGVQISGQRSGAPANQDFKALRGASVGELEAKLAEQQAAGTPVKTVQKALLSKYALSGDVEKAEALRKELEAGGFIFTGVTLRDLMFMEAQHKQDLQAALAYLTTLKDTNPDFHDYIKPLVLVSGMLMREGKHEEAHTLLREYASEHAEFIKQRGFGTSYELEPLFRPQFEAAIQTGTVEDAKALLELAFEHGFVQKTSRHMVDGLVAVALDKCEAGELVALVRYCAEKYERTPLLNDVLSRLAAKEDAENLQLVMDLVTPIHGEMNALHQLIAALVDAGKFKQAQKVLETPGLRASMDRLKYTCEWFTSKGKMEELRQLVSLTKELFGVDRDEMLFQLLRAHARRGEIDEALAVRTQYDEEGVLPRPRTLRYLANALKTAGRDVPFDVPERVAREPAARAAVSASQTAVLDALLQHDTDRAFTLLQHVKESEEEPVTQLVSGVAASLRQDGKANEFRNFVRELGERGEVDMLNALNHSLPRSVRHTTTAQLVRAHAVSGRGEEVLQLLQTSAERMDNLVNHTAVKSVAEHLPDLLPQVEEASVSAALEHEQIRGANCFWELHFLAGRYDQADDLLKRIPRLHAVLRVSGAISELQRRGEMEPVRRMIESLKGHNRSSLTFAYSHLIGMHSHVGEVSEALSVVQEAEQEGVAGSDFMWGALVKLNAALQTAGVQAPAQLQPSIDVAVEKASAQRARRSPAASDGSGSSDSDSSRSGSDSSDSDSDRASQK